ncbi:TB2/DP1, HVA22 family-domain-containing protein [Haematococcus lacustris]
MLLSATLAKPLLVLTGYLWPVYQTYKAVSANSKDGLQHWCTYWLVLGCFLTVEWLLDYTVFWLPLYFESKLLFLLFLWHPRTQGAALIYNSCLHPLLHANEARIDSTLEEAKARLVDLVTGQFTRVRGYVLANAHGMLELMRTFSEQVQGKGGRGDCSPRAMPTSIECTATQSVAGMLQPR